MSSFNGVDLFGSGPHRFMLPPAGYQFAPRLSLGLGGPGVSIVGLAQVLVTVSGRLVAPDLAGLEALMQEIRTAADPAANVGQLIDNHGRIYEDMTFLRCQFGERTDRGREVSVTYVATFAVMAPP